VALSDNQNKMTIGVEADTGKLTGQLQEVANQGVQLGNSLTKAFDGLIIKGQSFGDVLRALALNLSKLALNSALKPLEQSLNQSLSGIFNGGVLGGLPGGVPFAKGGVTQGGMPVPFAAGGVISSPISFPLANGRTGIAGERGPEAIMPLTRGPDGRLGVATSGGGAVHVTFNVSTPDAGSFQKSEAQISALLSRAVSQGQRNL
jgi:phage-related minor tail protein